MAKFRMVHTEFWNDPKVIEEMTPEDRYFFLYLLTNSNTTQIGIYQITKRQMAFDTGYSLETITSLLDRFTKHHKILKYNENTREIAIRNWGKYNLNRGGKPMIDCVTSELKEVKDFDLISYVGEMVEHSVIKGLYDTCHDTSTISGQYKEEEKEEEEYKDMVENKFSPDSPDYKLTQLLISRMQKNNPNVRVPKTDQQLERWIDAMDKIHRLDNYTHKQIQDCIVFSQSDEFWRSNILSAPKLREKMPTLVLQMKRGSQTSKAGTINKPTIPLPTYESKEVSDEEYERMLEMARKLEEV